MAKKTMRDYENSAADKKADKGKKEGSKADRKADKAGFAKFQKKK